MLYNSLHVKQYSLTLTASKNTMQNTNIMQTLSSIYNTTDEINNELVEAAEEYVNEELMKMTVSEAMDLLNNANADRFWEWDKALFNTAIHALATLHNCKVTEQDLRKD